MNYVPTQGAPQSPFVLPETQPAPTTSAVAAFTPVSNPVVTMPQSAVLIPAAVPIPTPAPTDMAISGPLSSGETTYTNTPMPASTVVIPQPRPGFEGDSAVGSAARIRG